MSIEIIPSEDGSGFTIAVKGDGVEYVDPIKHISETEIKKMAVLRKATSKFQFILPDEFFLWDAKKAWLEIYKKVIATPIPPNFLKLFESKSKADQERFMDGASLTPYQLCNLWFAASVKFGCTFSNYSSEKLPNGIEENNLPKIVRVDGDKVTKVGPTTLTNGQLKSLVNQQKIVVARFLDNKDGWHCFYQTSRGAFGEEKGATGRPHLHYISDKWGYSRADVVDQIKKGSHPTSKVHIDLLDYKR